MSADVVKLAAQEVALLRKQVSTCPTCSGPCPRCKGKGDNECECGCGHVHYAPCGECSGRGRVSRVNTCPECSEAYRRIVSLNNFYPLGVATT